MTAYTHHCDSCGAWYSWDADEWISPDILRGWTYERADIPQKSMTCPDCVKICAGCGKICEDLVADEDWGGWRVCWECKEGSAA